MYLVLTVPNSADSTVCVVAPRLLTDIPEKALAAARQAQIDESAPFVELIEIYELEPERIHSLDDSLRRKGGKLQVYVSWKIPGKEKEWHEKYFGSFTSVMDDEAQSKEVERLLGQVSVTDGAENESIQVLRTISKAEHARGCALGAVPACTCGKREAEEFMMKYDEVTRVI
jgi:hypothetical protein